MKKNIKKTILWGGLTLLLLSACGPVNRFTRIKKTPEEYTRNFCCGDVAVSRAVEKKSPWIVYSDRDNNTTYYNPGGKVSLKKASYMDPFVVIGRKGEYLRLVKYSPEILENGKLRNRKQAEYYGWIHQDNLILSSRATTDIATGKIIKMITMLSDTIPLTRTNDFFSSDSVVIFKEPELLTPIGKIPFQKPVFLIKKSMDQRKSFIIGKERINPDSVRTIVSGWLSSSLVMPLGEMLYMDYTALPILRYSIQDKQSVVHAISQSSFDQYSQPVSLPEFVGLNPVTFMEVGDTITDIRTSIPIPVIDNSQNLVYSLSGKPITYESFIRLQQKLKNINLMFVFSGQKPVYDKFEQFVSSLQGLKGILGRASGYSYKVGAVIGFQPYRGQVSGEIPLSANIDSVLQTLETRADTKQQTVPVLNEDPWDALRRAFQLLTPHNTENNVVILIGENGNAQEQVDPLLIDNLARNNCRILGYQLYSDQGNTFNNFVLQVENMINRSSEKISQKKKDILVHSEQARASNQYVERAENVYSLDFPRLSMTQGWIVFPKKNEQLPVDLLLTSTDTLIRQIEVDNNGIISHLKTAFREAGVGRTKLNPFWLELQRLSDNYSVASKTFASLSSIDPKTNFPLSVQISNSELAKGKYTLFVTESELLQTRDFINDLTRLRVDYKYRGKKPNKKEKNRTCPDISPNPLPVIDTLRQYEYFNTYPVRKSMLKAYTKWVRDEKVYPLNKKNILDLSLSEAQQIIFSMPSMNPTLQLLKVHELKEKKILPDVELDKLLDYFLKKRKELEESITPENRMEINGQVYYKIDAMRLP